jgi:hypothetical protein
LRPTSSLRVQTQSGYRRGRYQLCLDRLEDRLPLGDALFSMIWGTSLAGADVALLDRSSSRTDLLSEVGSITSTSAAGEGVGWSPSGVLSEASQSSVVDAPAISLVDEDLFTLDLNLGLQLETQESASSDRQLVTSSSAAAIEQWRGGSSSEADGAPHHRLPAAIAAPSPPADSSQHLLLAAALASGARGPQADSPGFTILPPFSESYYGVDLGEVPGTLDYYGGMTVLAGDMNTLYIATEATFSSAEIYAVTVTRDAGGHISGFSGSARRAVTTPAIAANLEYGPEGVLFYPTWPNNEVGQIKPGSTTPDKIVPLGPLGVASAVEGLNFVPAGFAGEGKLKLLSWSGGQFYTADYAPDGRGTFDITFAQLTATLPNGPTSFAYVIPGMPQFANPSMLVTEWSSGRVAAYQVNSSGDPIVSTRREMIPNLSSAHAITVDPWTGDFLIGTWSSTARLVAVRAQGEPIVAETGFNDADGIHGDPVSGSPYALGPLNGQGSAEPGWLRPWIAQPEYSHVQNKVVLEGDQSLQIQPIGAPHRALANRMTGFFWIEQFVRFDAGAQLVGFTEVEATGEFVGNQGPVWFAFADGGFYVVDGVRDGCEECPVEHSGFTWQPDTWYHVLTLINPADGTWYFFVNGQYYDAPDPLGFRGNPSYLDRIRYVSWGEGSAYVDVLRVLLLE